MAKRSQQERKVEALRRSFERQFTVILKSRKTQRWTLEAMRQYLGSHLDAVSVEAIYPGRLIPSEKEMARDGN